MSSNDSEVAEKVRTYIRVNRASYSLRALRDRAIADGAPPDVVDSVIAELEPPWPVQTGADPGNASERRPKLWLVALVTAVCSAVASPVIVFVAVIAALQTGAESVSLVVFAFGVGVQVLLAALYARRHSVSPGVAVGLAVTPIAVTGLLVGGCLLVLTS